MHQPGVTAPIIGPRSMAQLEEYLGAPAVTLDAADYARIDAAMPPGNMVSAFLQAEVGPHPNRVL